MSATRTRTDWFLFSLLSAIWASAYAFTHLAVSPDEPALGFPPEFIIPVRLTIAAVILLTIAFATGGAWPSLRNRPAWFAMIGMGATGMTLPFFLITHAQRSIDSSLAALYVATAPIFVAIFAHYAFHDDRFTSPKALGIVIGFLGVAVLFGPEAITAFGSASVTAQLFCLFATSMYATSTIIARSEKDIPPLIFAAGFATAGAIMSWPLLLLVDFSLIQPSTAAKAGLVALAILPTAFASLLYIIIVQRTSATFLAMTGYLIPILSAIIGYFAFGETQHWHAVLAFILILSGVWLSQRTPQA